MCASERPEKLPDSRSSGARRGWTSHAPLSPSKCFPLHLYVPPKPLRVDSPLFLLYSPFLAPSWLGVGLRRRGGGTRRREEEARRASTHRHRTQGTATSAGDTGEQDPAAFPSSRCAVCPSPFLQAASALLRRALRGGARRRHRRGPFTRCCATSTPLRGAGTPTEQRGGPVGVQYEVKRTYVGGRRPPGSVLRLTAAVGRCASTPPTGTFETRFQAPLFRPPQSAFIFVGT